MTTRKNHWENIYQNKDYNQLSWYQESPDVSLELLEKIDARPEQSIIDIGSGTSLLSDYLIGQGFRNITLVDLSTQALSIVKKRLGDKGNIPHYLSQDITQISLSKSYDIWHDRAVFHFLTSADDRMRYMQNLSSSLSTNGHAIIGTFSLNGPSACSGLDIVQYDEDKMQSELIDDMELEYSLISTHIMPNGSEQEFIYFILKHKD